MSFSQRSQWALWLGKGTLMQEVHSPLNVIAGTDRRAFPTEARPGLPYPLRRLISLGQQLVSPLDELYQNRGVGKGGILSGQI